jgi:subtilisin-like proprotein convertase family protein
VTQDYVIESIQIKISTNHTQVGDLGVELTSPSGTNSKLLLINSNIQHAGLSDYTLLTNAFYREHSLGDWTIKVIDGAASDIGHLTSWKIKVNGH